MEGLSTGIDIGYAQVLKPTDQSDYFKLAADMQKTADAVKKAKEEKQKKQKDLLDEQLLKITADLPEKVYTEHQKDIDNQKQTFINNAIKAAETGDLSTKKILELQLEGNRLKSEANQSAAYAKQIETLKKLNPDDYIPSSKEYISQLYSGYNPDGTRNYQVDINKFIEKPNYTKLAQTKIKPLEEDEGEATFTPAGAPGIYKSKQTKVLRLTPEEIDAEKEALWQTAYSNQGNQILLDVKENIERNNPKYSDYASLVYDDQQGIPQYDKAAEQFFKDNVNLRPIEKKRSVTKFVSERGYKGGTGAGVYQTYDPEYVTTDVSDIVRPSEDFYNTLRTKNPNLGGIRKGQFKYVNYSLSGAVKDEFAEAKDVSGKSVNKLIVDEVSGKYYDFAGNDVTEKVKKLSKSGDIETQDVTTPSVNVTSYLPNIQKSTIIKLDPKGVNLSGQVTKDGIPTDDVVSFTTDEMEIVDDKRGPYLKGFEIDKFGNKSIIKIPYTKKIDEIISGKINFVSKGKDTWETPDFIDFSGKKKQSTAQKSTTDNTRPDNSKKGSGYLGILKSKDGKDVTEYSVQSDAVKLNGKRIDFPTIVPTLTKSEIDLMLNDIIPNNKEVPESIMQKAINHAKKRISEGKSVFANSGNYVPSGQKQTTKPTSKNDRKAKADKNLQGF